MSDAIVSAMGTKMHANLPAFPMIAVLLLWWCCYVAHVYSEIVVGSVAVRDTQGCGYKVARSCSQPAATSQNRGNLPCQGTNDSNDRLGGFPFEFLTTKVIYGVKQNAEKDNQAEKCGATQVLLYKELKIVGVLPCKHQGGCEGPWMASFPVSATPACGPDRQLLTHHVCASCSARLGRGPQPHRAGSSPGFDTAHLRGFGLLQLSCVWPC